MTEAMHTSNRHVKWNDEKGVLKFENQDAILLWIDTAMKSFLESIEDISGDDAAKVVMENAGFRMGKIVTQFYSPEDPNEVMQLIPEIYASAGWGKFEVEQTAIDQQIRIRMTDSWEYKVNKQQQRKELGAFLPGHFTGIWTELFQINMNYEIVKCQLAGDPYDEIICFPAQKSLEKNIHDYSRKQEQLEISKLEEKVQERTKELTNLVNELSSPIIPVLDQIAVIPLIGTYDEQRANETIARTMGELHKYNANYLIFDLTGVDDAIDEHTVSLVDHLTSSIDLLGTKSIIVGISPQIAVKLVKERFRLKSGLHTFSTLQKGIEFALAQEGKKIIG